MTEIQNSKPAMQTSDNKSLLRMFGHAQRRRLRRVLKIVIWNLNSLVLVF